LERIALCACLLDSTNGPILEDITGIYQPQVALWYGDAVYADTTDPAAYRDTWNVLGANPRFQALKALCPQYAVWDDHDYGVNNGYATNHPTKVEAQQIFQDFWEIPMNSPLRQQEGVYNGFSWGPAGRRVQVLMLDVRYNRSAFGAGGTMLGAAQWEWLSARLDEPAEFRLIVSGVPWIATTEDECWSLMPGELTRFYDLIQAKGTGGVVLVSGDDHAGEVCLQPGAFGYDALDLTVAGLDRGEGDNTNPLRITPRVGDGSKFGFINIEWAADPVITLGCQVGGRATPEFEVQRLLSELQPA
jgi:alkaline phosphatase D